MNNLPITAVDILIAAVFSLILVFVFRAASRLFKQLVTRTIVLTVRPDELDPEQLDAFLVNCARLFPIEALDWNGTLFSRGNFLQVTTNDNTIIEGEFIGINEDGMVCLMTNHSVIAQEITTIEHIVGVK